MRSFPYMEAEPILVLTRREGASFVLDLTCDRLALHVPAAPSTTCVITCVPYAVTCERLSTTQQECHCVDLYHTCETPCVIFADKYIFTKHTNAVDYYAYYKYILQWVWTIHHRSRILRPAFFMATRLRCSLPSRSF